MHGRGRGGVLPGWVPSRGGVLPGWGPPRDGGFLESPRGLGPSDEPIKKHYAHIKEEFISLALHSARCQTRVRSTFYTI